LEEWLETKGCLTCPEPSLNIDNMTTKQLTELEEKVLQNLYMSAVGNGHDFGFVEDHDIDPKQARGVISSLIKKDIIEVHDAVTNCSGTWTQFTWKNKDAVNINSFEDVLS
jgi:hypothetical protein